MIAQLLELCGFEPKELEAERPSVETTFQRLGLTAEDIARANKRIPELFDIELQGVRKILGVAIKELVDLVLAKEQKRKMLYPSVPTIAKDIFTAAMLNSEEVHPASPGAVFLLTMGCIFDKLDPVFEAAERLWLNPGQGHCGYPQVELGLNALDLIPKADLYAATAFPCDELSKSFELMSLFFAVPVQWVNRCQDRDWREPVNLKRDREFIASEVQRAIKRVEEVVGFELTDEMLAQAEQFRAATAAPMAKIHELIRTNDPPPISSTIVPYLHFAISMPATRRAMEGSAKAGSILLEEMKHRVSQGIGVVSKGAPRVLHQIWPNYSDPSVVRRLEELGVAVVIFEGELYESDDMFSPDTRGFARFPERFAARTTQRINYSNYRIRANGIINACNRFNLDGVFWWNHPPCRYYGTDAWLLKDIVQKELGIPFLVVEGDFFDPRFCKAQQLGTKLEAFAEMVKDYKASKAA